MTRIRAAIVGLEHYHVTGWAESFELLADRIEIVARYHPDPSYRTRSAPDFHDPGLAGGFPARYVDVPFESDLDTLISRHRPELALVTLPNSLAAAAIGTLGTAGVHMLVDKPGARTADELRPAVAAARAGGARIAAALTKRHMRAFQDARALVRDGRLGPLFTAEALFTSSSITVRNPANPLFSRERSGGGVLHWIGIHDLDQLTWLTGDRIVEVRALAGTTNGEAIDVEDAISVAVRFASGAIGTIHYAFALPRPGSDGHVALRGRRGSVVITPDGQLSWIGAGDVTDPVLGQTGRYTYASERGYGSVGLTIIADLLDAIAERRDPVATGEDLVRALELIDAAYAAAASGEPVLLA